MHPQKTLLQVLFPKARAEIFRLLFGTKRRPRYVRELMGDSSLALRSVQDELKRLSVVGIVTSHSDGFRRFFAANTAHPLYREIARISEVSERHPLGKMFGLSFERRELELGPSRGLEHECVNLENQIGEYFRNVLPDLECKMHSRSGAKQYVNPSSS